MYCFVKQGIRGGMAGVMLEREAVANNEFVPVFLEPMPKTANLLYFDATNLYGWAHEPILALWRFQMGCLRMRL